jgi:HK97 gp10 family phage protein
MAKGIQIEGMEDVLLALKQLKGAAQAAVLADAGEESMELVRDRASQNAPRRTGGLSRDMQKEVVERRDGFAAVEVGPHKDDFYGLFIEKGWKPAGRSKKTGGKHQSIGSVAPRPFLRPALDTQKNNVFDRFGAVLSRWFDRIR